MSFLDAIALAAGAGLVGPKKVTQPPSPSREHCRRKGSKKYLAAQIDEVQALRARGHSWSRIARATGIPQGSLSYLAYGTGHTESVKVTL